MATAFLLLGLVAACLGQLRYPNDDFFKSTTVFPFSYSTVFRQSSTNRKANVQPNLQPLGAAQASTGPIVFNQVPRQHRFEMAPRIPDNALEGLGTLPATSTAQMVFLHVPRQNRFQADSYVSENALQGSGTARTTWAGPMVFRDGPWQDRFQTDSRVSGNPLQRPGTTRSALKRTGRKRATSARQLIFPEEPQQGRFQTASRVPGNELQGPRTTRSTLKRSGRKRTTSAGSMVFPEEPRQVRFQADSSVYDNALQGSRTTRSTLKRSGRKRTTSAGPMVFPEEPRHDRFQTISRVSGNALQGSRTTRSTLQRSGRIGTTSAAPMVFREDHFQTDSHVPGNALQGSDPTRSTWAALMVFPEDQLQNRFQAHSHVPGNALQGSDPTRTTWAALMVFPEDQLQNRFQAHSHVPGNALQESDPPRTTSVAPMVFPEDHFQTDSHVPGNALQRSDPTRTTWAALMVFPEDQPRNRFQTDSHVPGNALQESGPTRTTPPGTNGVSPESSRQNWFQMYMPVRENATQLFGAAQTTPIVDRAFPKYTAQYQVPMYPPLYENALQMWKDHVNDIIVNGILKFTLDVEREIYRTRNVSLIDQPDNIIFSPISLTVALAIILAGSAGRTFDEVTKVLGLESGVDISRHSEIVHQMFGIMLNQLNSKIFGSPGPQIDFATAMYVQEGIPILSQFKALSNEVYQTEVINVDFTANAKAAQAMINAWVKKKTMGKITSILNEPPNSDTMMILLSALYFNGEWNQHFFDGATKRKPFFIEPNESVNVDMMYNGGMFPFHEDKQLGVKILGLPYKGHEISMYILLPTTPGAKALREFTNKLTIDIIENLVKSTKNQTCIIALPRMKLSSSLSLKATLESLGLRSLFNPAMADLSLLSQLNNRNIENTTPSSTTPPMSTPYWPGNPNLKSTVGQEEEERLIFSRVDPNEDQANHMVKRNFFAYEDKLRGYSVRQWATGYSIHLNRRIRELENKEDRNSYTVGEKPEGNDGNAKVVNLEENKYRFQKKENAGRKRRQSRPIDQNFVKFIKERNFPSYGLDNLRNNANLINPHIVAADVLQKVEIDITEKGTEAAAVTSVSLERDGSQKKLIANRPFIFFIRYELSRLVLFWGTVNVPTPNYPAT